MQSEICLNWLKYSLKEQTQVLQLVQPVEQLGYSRMLASTGYSIILASTGKKNNNNCMPTSTRLDIDSFTYSQ